MNLTRAAVARMTIGASALLAIAVVIALIVMPIRTHAPAAHAQETATTTDETWDPPDLSVDREYSTSTGIWNLRFSWTTDRDDLKSAMSMHVRHVGSGEEYTLLYGTIYQTGTGNTFSFPENFVWRSRYSYGNDRSQLTPSEFVIGFEIIGEEPQRVRYSTPVELSLLDWPWVAPQLTLEKTGTDLSLTWTSNRDYLHELRDYLKT